jgi:bifunctional DNA-binding transcriptional regulator/antitoxin component of YhaV-PrlF toxin-antitoxin module
MKSWVVTLEEDPATGELILPLSDEILEGSGISIGDTVEWIDNKDGSWTLRKKDDNTEQDATSS